MTEENRKSRRSLMALLGGVAGFGVAKKVSGQQASTLSNMPYASTPLSGAELAYVVQNGISKKTPVLTLGGATGLNPGGATGSLQYNNAGAFGGYGVGSGLSVVGGNLTVTVGSSVTIVASIAALQALSFTAGQTVYLNAGGRSGFFSSVSGNQSANVSHDPGHGIWIAPGSASTGASGAWQRQKPTYADDWAWWGAIPDGVTTDPWGILGTGPTIVSGTDNAVALWNWAQWAEYQAGLGIGSYVRPSPSIPGVTCTGQYNYSANGASGNAAFMFAGLPNFVLDGGGLVTLQNTYNASISGANFNYSAPVPFAVFQAPVGYLINQTVVGSNSVTLTTAAQAANFAVGQWVEIASLDSQFNGVPFNPGQYEFHQITSVNASTGVIGLQDAIEYQHRADYPDYNLSGAGNSCGKARIWALGQSSTWNISHKYIGMTFNRPPGNGQGYWTITGKEISTEDCIGPGTSESLTNRVCHTRYTAMTGCEIDKSIKLIRHEECDFSLSGMSFQSASPTQFIAHGGKYNIITGTGKNLSMTGSVIGTLQLGTTYGYAPSATFVNCTILNKTNAGTRPDIMDGVSTMAIDGTNVAYANGVFTLNKSGLGFNIALFNATPGMNIGFEATLEAGVTACFPGDNGMGVITTLTEDATNIYIGTTLAQASVPSWCDGAALMFHTGQVRFQNCKGSGSRSPLYSIADNLGLPYYNYLQLLYGGQYTASNITLPTGGSIVSIEVNVIAPNTVSSGATISFIFFTAIVAPTTVTADTGGTIVTINTGITGRRTITQAAFSGALGTDSVKIGSGSASVQPLPAGRVQWHIAQTSLSSPPTNATNGGVFTVKIVFDSGSIARLNVPSTGFFVSLQGLPPQ